MQIAVCDDIQEELKKIRSALDVYRKSIEEVQKIYMDFCRKEVQK